MRSSKGVTFCILMLCSLPVAAKDKKKVLLTDDVLQARTVYVLADTMAGVDVTDPMAQRNARLDVETALRKWGRFELLTEPYTADLIIVVRKGNGKIAKPTIGGVPFGNDPVIMRGPDQGNLPANQTDPAGPLGQQDRRGPMPQMEAGSPDDVLFVYRGHRDNATESPAAWRYSSKDVLRGPAVRAVDEFHKVIDEAEKQRAAKP
jgi:hypothetical protein